MARGWEPSLALVALSGASFLCFSGPYVIIAACLAHLYQSCSSAGVCAYVDCSGNTRLCLGIDYACGCVCARVRE